VKRNECKPKEEIDKNLSNIGLYVNTKENFLDFTNFLNPYNTYLKGTYYLRPG
jgi:hypothetical protein